MKKAFFFILLTVLLSACADSYETQKQLQRAQQQEYRRADSLALKVGVLPTLDCLPLYVAKERRLFDTLGVDVRLKQLGAQIDCDVAFSNKQIEGMVSDLVRTERLRLGGTAIYYVASTDTRWQLIANHRARVRKPGQLADKTVGMTRFSATDCLTALALKDTKVNGTVFSIQINDPQTRLRMLVNNELDAAWLAEPLATAARLRGNAAIADSNDLLPHTGVIAFRGGVRADKHRSRQLDLFTKAYNMACDSLNTRGIGHYADILEKYYAIDAKTIAALPASRFAHAAKPAAKYTAKAAALASETLKP